MSAYALPRRRYELASVIAVDEQRRSPLRRASCGRCPAALSRQQQTRSKPATGSKVLKQEPASPQKRRWGDLSNLDAARSETPASRNSVDFPLILSTLEVRRAAEGEAAHAFPEAEHVTPGIAGHFVRHSVDFFDREVLRWAQGRPSGGRMVSKHLTPHLSRPSRRRLGCDRRRGEPWTAPRMSTCQRRNFRRAESRSKA